MSEPASPSDASDSDGARVALLTQCADYVGPALARELGRSGHRLALHGARPPLLDELAAAGVEAVAFDGDLTTAAGNRTLVEEVLGSFGRIDAACIVTGLIVTGRFLKASAEDWEFLKKVNLDMVFHGLQAVLPPMVEQGSGQVVVFTSATGARYEPRAPLYSATRAGANALVQVVAQDVARDGVCLNAVGTNFMDFPGFIAGTGAADPEVRAKLEAQVPLGRFGTLEELAAFTGVLLDGRNRFQTGQFFSFSGGWST